MKSKQNTMNLIGAATLTVLVLLTFLVFRPANGETSAILPTALTTINEVMGGGDEEYDEDSEEMGASESAEAGEGMEELAGNTAEDPIEGAEVGEENGYVDDEDDDEDALDEDDD